METTMETGQMARFGGLLIHYYLVMPAPQFRAGIPADRVRLCAEQAWQPAGARLSQRWARQPDGTLEAKWQTG